MSLIELIAILIIPFLIVLMGVLFKTLSMIIMTLSIVKLICSLSILLPAILIFNSDYNIKDKMIGGGLLDKLELLLLIVPIDILW